jgi:hypothetical protein
MLVKIIRISIKKKQESHSSCRLILDLFVKHVLLRNGRVRIGHTPEELGILPTPEVRL